MRRREAGGVRHELLDAERWPRCDRFDGETQPCVCWFAKRQEESVGEWPGGDVGMLSDWLDVVQQHHERRAPFDPSAI